MSSNVEILKQVDHEKIYDPFKVFARFYKAFYFPGFGHFSLKVKPKQYMFPLAGIIMLALIVFFGAKTISKGGQYETLRYLGTYYHNLNPGFSKDWTDLQTALPKVQAGEPKVTYILTDKAQIQKLKSVLVIEKKGEIAASLGEIGSVIDACNAEIEESKKQTLEEYDFKAKEGGSADEANIMKERDRKIEKEEYAIRAKYEEQIKLGSGALLYKEFVSLDKISQYTKLISEYKYKSSNYKIKCQLLFILFFAFWIYTIYDFSKILNFGKVYKMITETRSAFGFLSINILGFLTFTLGPVIFSLLLAFTKWDILTDRVFVGLENFQKLIADPFFWKYFGNTLFFFINIPLGMIASVLLALAMNQKIKGITFFRVVYYLPVISSMVAVALLWRWIYNPDFGLLNTALRAIGIANPPAWLSDTLWAKPAITIMQIWKGVGGGMLLYLAALQGIPDYLYEAADIDGASKVNQFRHITMPLLGPTHFFNIITGVIGTFQQFGAQYVMTQGGPAGSTTTIVYYIYNNAFQWFKMGYASAVAWVLFAIVFVATIINWRYTGGKLYTD